MSARRRLPALAALALVLPLASCGADPGNASGPIATNLTDYRVNPTRDATAAGPTSFAIDNRADTTTHEFVVVRTDLDPAHLPTDEDGAFDEKGDGIEFIDEKENIGPGEQASLTVDLKPGRYVLLCNLEDHYARGMYQRFEVTP